MIAILLKWCHRYLMEGDFFIGASIATTLTKLALRFVQLSTSMQLQNQFCAEAMLVITSVLHLGRSGLPQKPISNDDAERLGLCLKVLLATFSLVWFDGKWTSMSKKIGWYEWFLKLFVVVFEIGIGWTVACAGWSVHWRLPPFHFADAGRQSRGRTDQPEEYRQEQPHRSTRRFGVVQTAALPHRTRRPRRRLRIESVAGPHWLVATRRSGPQRLQT